jgi:ribosomal 30S subunit maturation factor RimM
MLNPQNIHSKPTQKVGFVLKPHGYKGWLRIHIDEEEIEEIVFQSDFIYLELQNQWVPFKIEDYNPNIPAVKFFHLNSETDTTPLLGASILLFSDLIPEDLNQQSFESFKVFDSNDSFKGIVVSEVILPGHVVLEIELDSKVYMVPFHPDLVLQIDEESKVLKMKIAEGLEDLND